MSLSIASDISRLSYYIDKLTEIESNIKETKYHIVYVDKLIEQYHNELLQEGSTLNFKAYMYTYEFKNSTTPLLSSNRGRTIDTGELVSGEDTGTVDPFNAEFNVLFQTKRDVKVKNKKPRRDSKFDVSKDKKSPNTETLPDYWSMDL